MMSGNKGAAASFAHNTAFTDSMKGALSINKCNLSFIHHTTGRLCGIFILINLIKIDPDHSLFYRQIRTHKH